MAESHMPKSTSGEEEQHISPTTRPAGSTLYAPLVQSSEANSSGPPRTLHDEVVEDLAPPARVSSTSPSDNANLTAAAGPVYFPRAPAMAEQSGKSEALAHHPSIEIADLNTPQVAQNAGVSQGQSHDDQTASRSPSFPSSPTAGDGNETDETEYCYEGVGLDGTDEGVDIDLLLQRVADDDKARKRNEGL